MLVDDSLSAQSPHAAALQQAMQEIIPDGFEWAMFQWDTEKSSKKLQIDEQFNKSWMIQLIQSELLTVKVKDGSGFKTSFGDQPFKAGGRYYFQVQLNQGNLVKIGVSRKDIQADQGTICFSYNNLQNWGVAFKDDELKKINNYEFLTVAQSFQIIIRLILFPAVAPIYSGDSYSIRRPTPED